MAKRQNFVVGSTNSNIEIQTDTQLNHAWDSTVVLHSNKLNGVFNAVSDYSNDSSNEIANAILSITGSQPSGATQTELADALQQMRAEIETSSLTFKGYIATSAPSSSTYALEVGNIWINAATLPSTFPVAIAGVWDGTQWSSTTDTYSPNDFDFFRNLNDNEGYYWFGGQWTVMSTDLSTTYFTLNQGTGKWEIKSNVELPGTPTVETAPTTGDNSKKIPSTAWVNTAIGASALPVGAIVPYGGTTAPAGFLICDGSEKSRTEYANLFAVIGTLYGTGDGTTTFNLPKLTSGQVPIGAAEAYIGQTTKGHVPNITGKIGAGKIWNGDWGVVGAASGAFAATDSASGLIGDSTGTVTEPRRISLDASRVSSVYTTGYDHVEAQGVYTNYIIKY